MTLLHKSVHNILIKAGKPCLTSKILRFKHNIVPVPRGTVKNIQAYQNVWVEVADPKGSGAKYWWNSLTNETTSLGAPKPETWIEQKDPAGTNLTYWWNPETNETTPLGFPNPSKQTYPTIAINGRSPQPTTFGGLMAYSMALGFGMSFAFMFVRVLLG